MSPMEEIRWFERVIPAYFPLSATAPVMLTQFNANRVGLIISASNTSMQVAPDPNLPSGVIAGAKQGIVLNTSMTFIQLTQRDWGILVQSEWWGVNNTGTIGSFTTVEVKLRDWPEVKSQYGATQQLQDSYAEIARLVQSGTYGAIRQGI